MSQATASCHWQRLTMGCTSCCIRTRCHNRSVASLQKHGPVQIPLLSSPPTRKECTLAGGGPCVPCGQSNLASSGRLQTHVSNRKSNLPSIVTGTLHRPTNPSNTKDSHCICLRLTAAFIAAKPLVNSAKNLKPALTSVKNERVFGESLDIEDSTSKQKEQRRNTIQFAGQLQTPRPRRLAPSNSCVA